MKNPPIPTIEGKDDSEKAFKSIMGMQFKLKKAWKFLILVANTVAINAFLVKRSSATERFS